MSAREDAVAKVFRMLEQVETAKAAAIEALLAERREIDKKLKELGYAGGVPRRRRRSGGKRRCSKCGKTGHNARSCKAK